MLEIFALPYFAISGLIGWVIFKPFFRAAETESLTLGDLTTTDLLAVSLPASAVFCCTRWIMPESILSLSVQAIVVSVALLFAMVALTVGLHLVPTTSQLTFLKRMAVVGVIAPFGILLTIGWIGLLIWAATYSIAYLIPSSIAVAAVISGLASLSVWVCKPESKAMKT